MDQHGHGPSTRTHLFGSASEAPQRSRDPHMNTHALYLLTKSRSHSGVFPLLWQSPSLPPTKTARAPYRQAQGEQRRYQREENLARTEPPSTLLRASFGKLRTGSVAAQKWHRQQLASATPLLRHGEEQTE